MVPTTDIQKVHLRQPASWDSACGGNGVRVGSSEFVRNFLSAPGKTTHVECLVCKGIMERLESASVEDESRAEEETTQLPPEGPTVALKGGAQVFRA